MRVLTTGANGFVGAAVHARLAAEPTLHARAATRSAGTELPGAELARVGDIGPDTRWREALRDVDVVVHCAARVHVMHESDRAPLAAFRRVNVDGTLNLAHQALESGVRRFVFLSSIKVNGEGTHSGTKYRASDRPAPVDPYGVSKREAEDALHAFANGTGLEVVVIRPVLVYGPGVKGNFQSMLRWLKRGVPLPLGAIPNRRSLVALDNLVDLVRIVVAHPAAANDTFLVSDDDDLSTSELLRRAAAAMNARARLVPVPVGALRAALTAMGRGAMAQRLIGSLQVDISHTKQRLRWTPPIGVDEGLRRATADLRAGA